MKWKQSTRKKSSRLSSELANPRPSSTDNPQFNPGNPNTFDNQFTAHPLNTREATVRKANLLDRLKNGDEPPPPRTSQIIRVKLTSRNLGYGILLDGARNSSEGNSIGAGVFVADVLLGGDAARYPEQIKIGRQITSINSVNVRTATVREVRSLLTANTEVLIDVVVNTELVMAYKKIRNLDAKVIECSLQAPQGTGTGLVFGSADSGADGVYVVGFIAGSAAESSPKVTVGDQVLALNNKSTVDYSQGELALAASNMSTMNLKLLRSVTQPHDVVVSRESVDQGFGLRMVSGESGGVKGYVVTRAIGPAATAGLKPGWHVTSINGVNLLSLSEAQLTATLAAQTRSNLSVQFGGRPDLTLYNKVLTETSLVPPTGREVAADVANQQVVRLTRSDKGSFGVVFCGAKDDTNNNDNNNNNNTALQGVFISRVIPGTPAANEPTLQPGACVLKINNNPVSKTNIYDIRDMLHSISDTLTLHVGPRTPLWNTYVSAGLSLAQSSEYGWVHIEIHRLPTEKTFGVVFGGAPSSLEVSNNVQGVFVSGSVPGTAASRTVLPNGFQMMTVNNADCSTATLESLVSVLASIESDTLRMSFRRNDVLRKEYTTVEPAHIVLRNTGQGFGIYIAGPANANEGEAHGFGVVISGVKSTGAASTSNAPIVGWQVLSINNTNTTRATTTTVKQVLRGVQTELNLTVIPNTELTRNYHVAYPEYLWTRSEHQYTIQVPKGEEGYGMEFSGAFSREEGLALGFGIMVSNVVKGSAAYNVGGVPIGWQVARVNGIDMIQSIFEDFKAFLGRLQPNETTLTLVLFPNKPLFAKYQARNKQQEEHVESVSVQYDDDKHAATSSLGPTNVNTSSFVPKSVGLGLSGFASTTVEDADTITINLIKDDKGFGIVFDGPKGDDEGAEHGYGMFVKQVRPDSVAERAQVPVGWQAVSVNGIDVIDGTFLELRNALQYVGENLEIILRENEALHVKYLELRTGVKQTLKTTLTRDENGFGIGFLGAKSEFDADEHGFGVFIDSVKPDSVAAANPLVRAGLQIMRLNNVDLTNGTIVMLRAIVVASGDTLEMELVENEALVQTYRALQRKTVRSSMIRKNMTPRTSTSTTDHDVANTAAAAVVVTSLTKNEQGFGLTFLGAKDNSDGEKNGYGVFIKGTKPGSVADLDAVVRVGLQIVSINSIDFSQGTIEMLRDVVLDAGDTLFLELQENETLVNTYAGNSLKRRPMRSSMIQRKGKVAIIKTSITKDDKGFGLHFLGANSHADGQKHGFGVFIDAIKVDSVADHNSEIRPGLQLLSVNGSHFVNGTIDMLKGIMQHTGDTLDLELCDNDELIKKYRGLKRIARRSSVLVRPTRVGNDEEPPQQQQQQQHQLQQQQQQQLDEDVIVLHKLNGAYGIKFGGAKTAIDGENKGFGLYVAGVTPDSAAALEPRIVVGHQIVRLNDVDLTDGTFTELKGVLKNHNLTELYIKLKENPELLQAYSTNVVVTPPSLSTAATTIEPTTSADGVITVSLTADTHGFGLKFGGAKTTEEANQRGAGIFISDVKPGSVAAKQTSSIATLQIVSFDNVDTSTFSFQDLKSVLENTTDTIVLGLKENDDLCAAYDPRRTPLQQEEERQHTETHAAEEDDEEDAPGFADNAEDEDEEKEKEQVEEKEKEQVEVEEKVEVKEKVEVEEKDGEDDGVVSFTLTKDSMGFGLKFGGAKNREQAAKTMKGVLLTGVKQGTVADRHPDVKTTVGWQIITVNAIDVREATFTELKAALATVEDIMSMQLRENPELFATHNDKTGARPMLARSMSTMVGNATKKTVTVTLTKDSKGFGLKFGGAKDESLTQPPMMAGVFVAGVADNSVAQRHPQLAEAIGWQILNVNGTDISSGTFKQLKLALANVGETITLELGENTELQQAWAQKKRASLQPTSPTPSTPTPTTQLTSTTSTTTTQPTATTTTMPSATSTPTPTTSTPTPPTTVPTTTATTVTTPTTTATTLPSPTITVTLTKDANGFGLKFGGAANAQRAQPPMLPGVFVAGVKPDSVAEANAEVKKAVGWQILSVNGTDTSLGTFTELKVALRDVADTLTLVLGENNALRAMYQK